MEIQVPEGMDILTLVAADFAAGEAMLGGLRAWAVNGAPARALEQALVFHVAQDRSIGRC